MRQHFGMGPGQATRTHVLPIHCPASTGNVIRSSAAADAIVQMIAGLSSDRLRAEVKNFATDGLRSKIGDF
jgi:tRNA(Leu) C34 or U34 (ribose-2'-O)-methylase TrmL